MKKIELLSICTVQDFWVTQRQTKYFPLNQTFPCKDRPEKSFRSTDRYLLFWSFFLCNGLYSQVIKFSDLEKERKEKRKKDRKKDRKKKRK